MCWRILPDPLAVSLAAATGAVAACLLTGQIGLFIAAALGAHLITLRTGGAARAGLWLSLLVLKPHTVFAVPLLHALTGRWRVIFWASAGGCGLILLTLALAWWRTNLYGLLLAHYGLSLAGVIFEIYFMYIQIVVIRAVCVWCTAYGVSLILRFVVALIVWLRQPRSEAGAP